MKKVLIICNAGMSSSLMAKKASNFLSDKGKDVKVEATTVAEGDKIIREGDYDLYLISPQMRMHFKKLESTANEVNKKISKIPFDAYSPTDFGVKKLADIIDENL